ncbi:hypothetical protein [Dyadobacter sp. LHD-138]|uniref:hypothetical protein n=1 Tax=Dyadobacter sp. LHD-138 TaxID=3071413 RepID=UPI0027E03EFE|nr:hypothetical protein [Dyadobacter sp. LHD-138]MDQ6482420.1 hypothetical protein [Dyadobacter sp. LHD-138]
MYKYQQIETILQKIDGALFQNICDAILFQILPPGSNITRTGSQIGKIKTIKGTPDSFFTLPGGKFILVECTTQSAKNKKAFIRKVKADINKCLDEAITGLMSWEIEKIVYCCNSSISIKELKDLQNHCKEQNVELDFTGIHTLARLLSGKCAAVARDLLNVAFDTGQILEPKHFIEEYETSALATPLSNEFQHRKKELACLNEYILSGTKVIVLAGASGVGKSKLALQCIQNVHKGGLPFKALCISNKNASIHDDLRSYLIGDYSYLILVDDANRQTSHFESLIALLSEKRTGTIQIIVTVRDYALEETLSIAMNHAPQVIKIEKLSDLELKIILCGKDFNLTDQAAERVLTVSDGNPRLAIMAARAALAANDLAALSDVSSIYDHYFKLAIGDHKVFNDKALQKTLGLLSFFFTLDYEDIDFFDKLAANFKMESVQLRAGLLELERLELAETRLDGSVIKISDQVLATYFFHKTFIVDQILDFAIILRHYLHTHLKRIKDSVISANNTFSYQKVFPALDPILSESWKAISLDPELAERFLNSFWFYMPNDVFDFVAGQITAGSEEETDRIYKYGEAAHIAASNRDKNLDFLSKFYMYSLPELDTALELSFRYVESYPEHYTQLIDDINSSFKFREEDEPMLNVRQLKLLSFLCENRNHFSIFHQSFYDIAVSLMKWSYNITSSGRKAHSFTIYNYLLPLSNEVSTFREKVWLFIFDNFEIYPNLSIDFLHKYLERTPDINIEIARFDAKFLISIFRNYLDGSSFEHCFIVRDTIYWLGRAGLTCPELSALRDAFNCIAYQHFLRISWDRLRDRFDYDYEYIDFEKYDRIKKIELSRNFTFENIGTFQHFYSIYLSIREFGKIPHYDISRAFNIVIALNFKSDPVLGLKIIDHILIHRNEIKASLYEIYKEVELQSTSWDEIYKRITSCEFDEKPNWVINYLRFIPPDLLHQRHADLFLNLLKTSDERIALDSFLMEKLGTKCGNIYDTALEISVSKTGTGNGNIFLNDSFFKGRILEFTDLGLVKTAYFQQKSLARYFDPKFEIFLEILWLDKGFLFEYYQHETNTRLSYGYANRAILFEIWSLPDTASMVQRILDDIFGSDQWYSKGEFAKVFFKRIPSNHRSNAVSFLKDYISSDPSNIEKINYIMKIVRECLGESENEFILHFLHCNQSFDDFSQIDWLSNSFSGSGEVVWSEVKSKRLSEIVSIFDAFGSEKYLFVKHLHFLKGRITLEDKSARQERRRKLMYGY